MWGWLTGVPEPKYEPPEPSDPETMQREIRAEIKSRTYKAEKLQAEAVKHIKAGNSSECKQLLKEKAAVLEPVPQLRTQLANLETVHHMVNTVVRARGQVDALKGARDLVRRELDSVDLDEVETVHDEVKDMTQEVDEMARTLGTPIGFLDTDTDDAVDREMREMMDAMALQELGGHAVPANRDVGNNNHLPERSKPNETNL